MPQRMNPLQARKAGQGQQPSADAKLRYPVVGLLILWGCCLLVGLDAIWSAAGQRALLAAEGEEQADRRVGQLIKIPAPVTDSVKARAIRQAKDFISQAKKRQEWPVIVFEIETGSSSFGTCLDLAQEITR